jgi:hypothetical protein
MGYRGDALRPTEENLKAAAAAIDRERGGINDPMMACRRTTAREHLQERLDSLLRQARGLERLLLALPVEMPEQADEALCRIIMERR